MENSFRHHPLPPFYIPFTPTLRSPLCSGLMRDSLTGSRYAEFLKRSMAGIFHDEPCSEYQFKSLATQLGKLQQVCRN